MERPSRALRVLIVEDSETDSKLIVQALRSSGFSPSWERVDRPDALREALGRPGWDVLISDSSVPRLGIREALALGKTLAPGVPLIVVSGSITEEQAVAAMRGGAVDYITKARLDRLGPAVSREIGEGRVHVALSHWLVSRDESTRLRLASGVHDQFAQLLGALSHALDVVGKERGPARGVALSEARALADQAIEQARGLRALSDQASSAGGQAAREPAASRGSIPSDSPSPQLTPRQREVLQLVVEGHSTKEIAGLLKISVKTVESHRAEIMDRLGIRNVASLVQYAMRAGILPPRG